MGLGSFVQWQGTCGCVFFGVGLGESSEAFTSKVLRPAALRLISADRLHGKKDPLNILERGTQKKGEWGCGCHFLISLAMEVSKVWDIALLLVTWFQQRKQKKPKKKADNYKICKAKGKAGPSRASSYYSKMKTKCGVDITRQRMQTCEVCHKQSTHQLPYSSPIGLCKTRF